MIVKYNRFNAVLFAGSYNKGIKDLDPSVLPTLKELSEDDSSRVNVLNLYNVPRSRRFNPIQHKYIPTLQDALDFSENIMRNFWSDDEYRPRYFQLYKEVAADFFAACIWFFVNYKKQPYDSRGTLLFPEYIEDIETHHKKLTGRVFNTEYNRDYAEAVQISGKVVTEGLVEPDYWLGIYSDLPHIVSFLCHDYSNIFDVLMTNTEIVPMVSPLYQAWQDKVMDLLELYTLPIRALLNKLCTPEAYWVFGKDGDDFDLRDGKSYIIINTRFGNIKMTNLLSTLVTGQVPTKEYKDMDSNEPWCENLMSILSSPVYQFQSGDARDRILMENMVAVNHDIEVMIHEILHELKISSI